MTQEDFVTDSRNAVSDEIEASPLAVVGTVAIDGVETPFGKEDRIFGGSASYFSYAASMLTPVSLVAVVGRDFPVEYEAILKERPIDLSHLEKIDGETFFWRGKYEADMNSAITLETRLNVLLEFNPKIRYSKQPDFLFLANIDPVLQLSVLKQIPREKLKYTACDTMNFWIENKKSDLLEVMKHIDCIVLNDAETRMLTGEPNLIRAAQKIKALGPRHVVIKKGEHGVLLFFENQFAALPAYPLESVFDPTGAGDSFAGGMMGYLTSTGVISFDNMKKAIAYGTCTASFTVEEFGLAALRKTDKARLEERLESFRKISSF